MRWYRDNPKDSITTARSIHVGIPPNVDGSVDQRGFAEGQAVPEADRDVNKDPIYHIKKMSIHGIPIVNEDGTPADESSREKLKKMENNDELSCIHDSA